MRGTGGFRTIAVGALFLYACLIALEALAVPVGPYDEAHQLLAGQLVGEGRVAHREFVSPYTPLFYYANAAAFALLGPTAAAARLIAGAILIAIAAGLLLHAGRVLGKNTLPAAVTALAGVVLIGESLVYIWWGPHALAVLVLLFHLGWLRGRGSMKRLVISGILTGLVATAKLNTGVYLAAAIGADLFVTWLHDRSWSRLRPILVYGACTVAPPLLYLLSYGGYAGEVLAQILVIPSRDTGPHRVMRLPGGALGMQYAAVTVLPLIWTAVRRLATSSRVAGVLRPLVLAAGCVILLAWFDMTDETRLPLTAMFVAVALFLDRWIQPDLERAEFVTLLATAFFGHYFLARADAIHHATMLLWAALLLPWAVGHTTGRARILLVGLLVGLFVLPLPGGLTSRIPGPTALGDSLRLLASPEFRSRDGDAAVLMSGPVPPRSPWSRMYGSEDEVRALRFVHERTTPADRIYMGGLDHARIYLGTHRGYWISDRRPGVRDYFIDVGYTTREEIQRRIAGDLETNDVEWIVLRETRPGDPDFRRRGHVGSTWLDEHLASRYVTVERFGDYEVRRRAGSEE